MDNGQSVMDTLKNNEQLEISIYPRGVPGYIYTPSVDEFGNLRWENNGNLPNPEMVNIMGPQGPQGLIEFQIVDELPETGSSLIMYLLTKRNENQNSYDEYIWVDNQYEFISEGKRTANENAQNVVGYYYSGTLIQNLNIANFRITGEYAIIVDNGTVGIPEDITLTTNVILKVYQTNPETNSVVYQELTDSSNGRRYVRTWEYVVGQWVTMGWNLGSSGGIEISDDQPTDRSTVLWVDTNEEADIFDPNDYYTKTETDTRIAAAVIGISEIINLIYPIGSIYISTSYTDPSILFTGTTWTRIKDRFLLAAGDTYAVNSTGGEASHTLTQNEMPSHTHTIKKQVDNNSGTAISVGSGSKSLYYKNDSSVETNARGGGQAHNNMPPYFTVYMWRRTA